MTSRRQSPHVLILVENLPVPADRRVWQEACALREAGYRVTVICPQMHGFTKPEEELEGIQIHRYRLPPEAKRIAGFLVEYGAALFAQARLAWRVWFRDRFQAVHLCNPPDLLFLVALPFKALGVRVVFDSHDLCPEMFEAKFGRTRVLGRLVRWAQRLTYWTADLVLATNGTHAESARTHGGKPASKIFLVPTVPVLSVSPGGPSPSLRKSRPFLVGYVGVFGSTDGLDLLMECAAWLVHRMGRGDVHFVLLGAGPEFEALRAMRDRLGLVEHVDMPGWAGPAEVASALRTLDVAVVCDPPNAYNHSCTMCKVLEYMAYGCPQVMFDLRENRVLAGDAAHYVAEYSAEALATGIARLLDDAEERQRLGERARKRFETGCTWDRSRTELLRAYALILGEPSVDGSGTVAVSEA